MNKVFLVRPLQYLNIPRIFCLLRPVSQERLSVRLGRERWNHWSWPRAIQECMEPPKLPKAWERLLFEWASLHHVTPRRLGYDLCYQQWAQSRTAHLFIVTKRKSRSMFHRLLIENIWIESFIAGHIVISTSFKCVCSLRFTLTRFHTFFALSCDVHEYKYGNIQHGRVECFVAL